MYHWQICSPIFPFHFLKRFYLFVCLFIYLFWRGRKHGEREGEKHWCARETSIGCLLHAPRVDLALNLGMYPDWELNRWHFASQAGSQSAEPHQPELSIFLMVSFAVQKLLSLMYFCLFIFSLFTLSLEIYGQKYCYKRCLRFYCLCFLLGIFFYFVTYIYIFYPFCVYSCVWCKLVV